MKQGLVKVLFRGGQVYTAAIAVNDDQELGEHREWTWLRQWWLRGFDVDKHMVHSVTWDDGSEVLLNRAFIMNITMEPNVVLEIN